MTVGVSPKQAIPLTIKFSFWCLLLNFRCQNMAKSEYSKLSGNNGEEKVSFVSILFFQWMNSIFKTGSERAIEETDFLPLAKENSTCSVVSKLQENWNGEIETSKGVGRKPKLWKSVIKMISVKEILVLTSIHGLYTLYLILQPLLLGYLMVSLMSDEPEHSYSLYGCAIAMGVNAVIGSICLHYSEFRYELWGIRISSALKGIIYLKVSRNNEINTRSVAKNHSRLSLPLRC